MSILCQNICSKVIILNKNRKKNIAMWYHKKDTNQNKIMFFRELASFQIGALLNSIQILYLSPPPPPPPPFHARGFDITYLTANKSMFQGDWTKHHISKKSTCQPSITKCLKGMIMLQKSPRKVSQEFFFVLFCFVMIVGGGYRNTMGRSNGSQDQASPKDINWK